MKTKLFMTGILSVALVFGFLASCELGAKTDGTGGGENLSDLRGIGTRDPKTGEFLFRFGDSSGRALTQDIAKNSIDYYEVVFSDGTHYASVNGWKGETLRIEIPDGTYDGTAGQAVVFAGKESDKTLLAIGELTVPASGVIDMSTTAVTFQLAEIGYSSASDLKIDSSLPTTATINSVLDVYYFQINNGGASPSNFPLSAEFKPTIPSLSGSGTNALVFNDDEVKVKYRPIYLGYDTISPQDSSPTDITASTPVTTPITFEILQAFPTQAGLTLLMFSIPVAAIESTSIRNTAGNEAIEWNLRPGLFPYKLDTTDTNSTGGGILLRFGTPTHHGGAGITIAW